METKTARLPSTKTITVYHLHNEKLSIDVEPHTTAYMLKERLIPNAAEHDLKHNYKTILMTDDGKNLDQNDIVYTYDVIYLRYIAVIHYFYDKYHEDGLPINVGLGTTVGEFKRLFSKCYHVKKATMKIYRGTTILDDKNNITLGYDAFNDIILSNMIDYPKIQFPNNSDAI